MSTETIAALLAVIAIASYFQTVTGFGLGMIVMGVTSGFDLAPIALVATLVSLVTLVNSGVALRGRLHHIDRRAAVAVLLGALPSIAVGLLLLDYLSSTASNLLQMLLGMAIAYSGIVFALRPTRLAARSPDSSFFISGLASGLFGGLFGMAGPPVIFHFYRQPFELVAVRSMLLLVFAFTAATRTIFVAYEGMLTTEVWLVAAVTLPLVALSTVLGRRYPPPWSAPTMRRIAFSVLIFIGVGLFLSAGNGLVATR